MRILALDAALARCSAAVVVDGEIVAERHQDVARGHAALLPMMAQAVLAEAGLAGAGLAHSGVVPPRLAQAPGLAEAPALTKTPGPMEAIEEASEIEASEIQASEIQASEIEGKEIEAKEIEAKEIEAKEIEAREMRAEAIEVAAIEPPAIEAGSSGTAAQLDLIAVTVGPGSFTGLRAGLALAHGIALAAGVPVVGVSVGEALAEAFPRLGRRTLWSAIDSRRGRIFLERDGVVVAMALEDLPRPDGPVAVAGDAAIAVAARLAARDVDVMLTDARLPLARHIARVGERRLAGDLPPRAAQPIYVDPPEARLPAAGLRPAPIPAAGPAPRANNVAPTT
jgi:tRNA threonylcarbamoyl adenosine modification protein YeaZ